MKGQQTRRHPEKHWTELLTKLKNKWKTTRIALGERETNSKASRKALDRVVNQTQRYIEDIRKSIECVLK